MTEPRAGPDLFRLSGTILDGRFHVAREIAEGGFGVVYYAIQIALDRPVALKVLKALTGMSDTARGHFHEKFAAEARTIARIRHPNIVDVYDFGISRMPSGELAPWMALEWINGHTLDDYLAARRGQGGQSPSEVLALLRPVLRAFAYTHRDRIAHRDIKPSNIMVVSAGANRITRDSPQLLRILDFGIAKVMRDEEDPGSGNTRTAGPPVFSPQYAAPEQVAYGRTGPWTDVHALGLILTELLVDSPAYHAGNIQLFEEIMARKRPTPGAKGKDVGPWEGVIAKALALSPGERWKSAAELLDALEVTAEAATSAAREPLRAPVVASRPTSIMPMTAAEGFASDQAPTKLRTDSLPVALGPAAEPVASPGAQGKEAAGTGARQSPRRESPGWRRPVVGATAVALIVAALVVARISLRRRSSEPVSPATIIESPRTSPAPATPTPMPEDVAVRPQPVEQKPSALSASDSVTKEEAVKPAGPRRPASPIEAPAAPASASIQTSRPVGVTRAAPGNPRAVSPRKPPPSADPSARTPDQPPRSAAPTPKPTQTPGKSIERLPIE